MHYKILKTCYSKVWLSDYEGTLVQVTFSCCNKTVYFLGAPSFPGSMVETHLTGISEWYNQVELFDWIAWNVKSGLKNAHFLLYCLYSMYVLILVIAAVLERQSKCIFSCCLKVRHDSQCSLTLRLTLLQYASMVLVHVPIIQQENCQQANCHLRGQENCQLPGQENWQFLRSHRHTSTDVLLHAFRHSLTNWRA